MPPINEPGALLIHTSLHSSYLHHIMLYNPAMCKNLKRGKRIAELGSISPQTCKQKLALSSNIAVPSRWGRGWAWAPMLSGNQRKAQSEVKRLLFHMSKQFKQTPFRPARNPADAGASRGPKAPSLPCAPVDLSENCKAQREKTNLRRRSMLPAKAPGRAQLLLNALGAKKAFLRAGSRPCLQKSS